MSALLAVWRTMPRSERIGAIAFAFVAPVLLALVAAVLPN